MSPFFQEDAHEFVTLLIWHIKWHRSMGFTKHMLYVVEQMSALVADERVQVCMYEPSRGLVRVLVFGQALTTLSSVTLKS